MRQWVPPGISGECEPVTQSSAQWGAQQLESVEEIPQDGRLSWLSPGWPARHSQSL